MTSIYAHRGSTGPSIRENTIAAFQRAAELGADGVELDVRRTADGVLVVHHDQEVGGVGLVSRCNRRALPAWVPSLEESIAACADAGLAVNVEVKSEDHGPSHDPAERCATDAAIVCAGAAVKDGLVASSFSLSALVAMRKVSARLALAWLVEPPFTAPKAWRRDAVGALSLQAVHPCDALVGLGLVAHAHQDNLAVRVWTVDDPIRIAELARLGVDAVITNDVAVARRALAGL